jgi:hypothetical protein
MDLGALVLRAVRALLPLLSVIGFVCQAPTVLMANEVEADRKQNDEQVRPFFARHCLECHSGQEPKGDLHLDQLKSDLADAATRKQW